MPRLRVSLSKIRLERDGFVVADECFFKALEFFESNAAIIVILKIRFERNGPIVAGESLFEALELFESIAAIRVSLGKIRL